MKTLIAAAVVLALGSSAYGHEGMSWSAGTSGGTLANSTVVVSIPGAQISTSNLSTTDFWGAPLSTAQSCVDYNCDTVWSATFTPPLEDLLWYGSFIRGSGANNTGLPVGYTFNQPFVILSGFSQGTISGTTLTLPGTGFHDGILKFTSPVASLICTNNATKNGRQLATFGKLCGATTYSTAKSGLTCGLPAITYAGVPSAGATSGFVISAAPARGQRSGLILYSCGGRASIPFQGGILCVNPSPLRRSSLINSGGTNGMCDGVFSSDWNAFASGNGGGNPDPCIQAPGQRVNTQIWGRDSVATGSFLSNGLEFDM